MDTTDPNADYDAAPSEAFPEPIQPTTNAPPQPPTPCVSGYYAVQFIQSQESIQYGFCTGQSIPPTYGIDEIGTAPLDVLGCAAYVAASGSSGCTFVSSDCVPAYDGASFSWNGEVVFARYTGRLFVRYVNGIAIYTDYGDELIGVGTVINGLCIYQVLITPSTP